MLDNRGGSARAVELVGGLAVREVTSDRDGLLPYEG